MKKFITVMLLPALLALVSSPVWAKTTKLSTQEKQLLGKWLCHYEYQTSDFAGYGYIHVEYLANKTSVLHEVSKISNTVYGETISGLVRYSEKADWWIDEGRIYDRTTEIVKLEFEPSLGAIPYWEEAVRETGNVYDERIARLDQTQFIRVYEDEYAGDSVETVCQRL